MLSAIRLTIDRYLCRPEFVGWKKSHRKARINKKWHKRYGPILRCKGHAYHVRGMGIVCCPCVAVSIKQELSQ
jgi:hypothetical protein